MNMTPAVLANAIRAQVDEEEGGDSSLLEMSSWASSGIAPDQEITCGTTLCVGGWGAYLLGYSFDRYGFTDVVIRTDDNGFKHYRHISALVQEVLELTDEQANRLFHDSTKDEALEIIQHIAEGHGFPQHMIRRRGDDAD